MAGNASLILNVREKVASLGSAEAQRWANHANRMRTVTLSWHARRSQHGHMRLLAKGLACMETHALLIMTVIRKLIAGISIPQMLTIILSDASICLLRRREQTSDGSQRQETL